ncbi:MAG: hypothetical protein GY732_12120 [Gammaproteobacteria bacterium]|nr:hypothetical protein [Gammaproteobacteria bacterium]
MVRRKSARRARARDNEFLSGDQGLHHGPTPSYSPVSRQDAQRMISAAFEVMSQAGVSFEPVPYLMDRLRGAGCDVSPDGLVKFPVELIQKSINSVAKSTRLWNRDGSAYIEIDCQHTWFVPGMTCIKVYDKVSGEPRDSVREDLATITRVSDALRNIDAVCVSCKIVDESDIHGEIAEFSTLAENTTKPLIYLCEFAESLGVVIDMATAIRGSRQELVDKPYFMHLITPLPLHYAKTHIDQLIEAVEAGVPVTAGTVTIGGASAPITIAGCVVHSLATDLTAVVLSQIIREGSFCIGSSDVSFMEAATGAIGSPSQSNLAEMAMCEISRMLGLPRLTNIAGDSKARRFNQDAASDISSNMTQAFYSRPAICPYVGSLDQGITYSLRALLLGDDLAGQLRSMWRGIKVSDDTLALDLIHAEGPRGNYLANEHTVRHCRGELWDSRYFGANFPISAGSLPDEDLDERIERELQDILLNHHPKALAPETITEIQSIADQFRKTATVCK